MANEKPGHKTGWTCARKQSLSMELWPGGVLECQNTPELGALFLGKARQAALFPVLLFAPQGDLPKMQRCILARGFLVSHPRFFIRGRGVAELNILSLLLYVLPSWR